MAEMLLVKDGSCLRPMPECMKQFDRLGDGEIIAVKWKYPRNVEFHRKFFALLKVGFENQEHYATMEQFRHVFLIETGHADPIISASGAVHWMPVSISFEKMDQLDFERLYSDLLDYLIAKHIFDGRSDVERELMRFM